MSITVDSSSNYVVDYSTEDVVNIWRTERLEFLKVEESLEGIRELLEETNKDPIVLANASARVLRPQGKSDLDSQLESMSKAVLGLAICLRRTEEEIKENKKPTMMGTMTLGWGGFNPRMAQHRSESIGIVLAKKYQNSGYGREALNWMIDFAFMHLGLHTVRLSAVDFNPRGIHLYQSLGFRLEGRRKETSYFNRKWVDELDFGMTEYEWEKMRGITR